MDKILIIGASGYCKVIIEIIESNKEYQIYGLIDSFKAKGSKVLGYPVIGDERILKKLASEGINKGFVAIGDNSTRHAMQQKITQMVPEFEFVNVIHPSSVISPSVIMGKGNGILAAVVINAQAQVGNFCILNTASTLGHDGIMDDFSSLAPGVNTGGNVSIGCFSAISLGAKVIQGITIGKHAIIGAGSIIIKNVEDLKLVYGVPAKEIRDVKKGEKYLSGLWNSKDSNE